MNQASPSDTWLCARASGREIIPGSVGYDVNVASDKVDLRLPEDSLCPGREI